MAKVAIASRIDLAAEPVRHEVSVFTFAPSVRSVEVIGSVVTREAVVNVTVSDPAFTERAMGDVVRSSVTCPPAEIVMAGKSLNGRGRTKTSSRKSVA